MKLFSKILFVFTVSLLLIPSSVFAGPAEAVFFDASVDFNSSCKLVVTYDLKIDPLTMTTTPAPGNNFKLSVAPDVASNIDYPISVPLDGMVTNGIVQTTFSGVQPYKIKIVEYTSGGSFVDTSTTILDLEPAPCSQSPSSTTTTTTGGGDSTSFNIDIDNPISVNSIPDLIQKVLEGLIKIGIPLLVVMIVYSGFLYLFARGEPAKITAAHEMLKYTLIGGAILLGAWALAQLIHTTLIEITASIIEYFV